MRNLDLRMYMKEKGIAVWRIAEALNVSDMTVTRKFQKYLSDEEKQYFRKLVDRLAIEKEHET